MASVLSVFDTDYDSWKKVFDSDPAGRTQSANGHRIMRSVDDPNKVFVQIDFGSVQDAREFRARLLASGVLDNFTLVQEPTLVDLADEATY